MESLSGESDMVSDVEADLDAMLGFCWLNIQVEEGGLSSLYRHSRRVTPEMRWPVRQSCCGRISREKFSTDQLRRLCKGSYTVVCWRFHAYSLKQDHVPMGH